MSIVAVVVTYNRMHDLEACLNALAGQTRPPDRVIVVDNGSTDGSRDFVLEQFPHFELYGATENVGGAGGFSFGLDRAIAAGAEAAWLMDDDAEPTPTALENLLKVQQANPDAPFWTSTTFFYDGTVEEARAGIHLRAATTDIDRGDRTSATTVATFVGVLVNLSLARFEPLPIADFFIWHDDSEYTSRLARWSPGVRALESRILHPYKEMYGDFGDRLRYDLRNRLWILTGGELANRKERRLQLALIPKILLKQAIASKNKSKYLHNVGVGFREGLFRRPRLAMPGASYQEGSFQRLGSVNRPSAD